MSTYISIRHGFALAYEVIHQGRLIHIDVALLSNPVKALYSDGVLHNLPFYDCVGKDSANRAEYKIEACFCFYSRGAAYLI